MSRVFALATNTFREAVRDRVLYSILIFSVGIIGLSLVLQEITVGDQEKVVRSVAQGGIDLMVSIIAMFLGVSLVWREVERKTIYTILSKPVPRWMFILGKYLGIVLTLAVEIAILMVVYTALIGSQQAMPDTVVYMSAVMLLIELMLLTAWATLFSTYSSPVTAGGFTIAVFVIGHLADDIWRFGQQAHSPAMRQASEVVYWLLPNFEVMSIREHAVHNLPVPWEQVGGAAAYGLLYSAGVLCLAMLVFSRRDLR
jgi:ABC-type transport system involved in multi-copper enzyme maturation permease subunit